MMLHRFPILVRRFSVIQDMAKRVLLDNAVNSLKAGGSELLGGVGSSSGGRPQVAPHLSPNVEVDADTWRSIVDSPVVDMEGMESSDLYPSSAPSLASLSAHSARSSEPWREEEGGGALDLSAFPGALTTDPFAYVASDLRGINASIKELLGVDHPMLSTVARYFFDWDGGKKVRPALVLLMAHAVNTHMAASTVGGRYTAGGHFTPSPAEVAAASDALAAGMPALLPGATRTPLPAQVVLPLQRRLAEITELIHTASLLHDDVLDGADTRRGVGSVNKMFGNKLAVLSGDFLLARASVCLARLRNVPAVELLSTVIEHLVKGEVMQMHVALRNQQSIQSAFDVYLRKTYFKTGSLIANSCKAISILGGYPDYVTKAAFEYGFHVGIAFQLVDDMLGECRVLFLF
jgi:geranylgeranyl pyrophosphate synthase